MRLPPLCPLAIESTATLLVARALDDCSTFEISLERFVLLFPVNIYNLLGCGLDFFFELFVFKKLLSEKEGFCVLCGIPYMFLYVSCFSADASDSKVSAA